MTVAAPERNTYPPAPAREDVGQALREAVLRMKPGDCWSPDRPVTVEEFCALGEDDRQLELINGVVCMSPPPSDDHEDLQGWLLTILRQYVEVRKLGKVRGSRSGVQVSDTSLPEPDLIFFRNEHLDRMRPSGAHGAPDLAVEIVDSDQARLNAVRKQAQYQEAGVTEIWIIDLPRRELRQFVRRGESYPRVEVDLAGEALAETVDGFRLRVASLFEGPDFPSSLDVVTALLSAPEPSGG